MEKFWKLFLSLFNRLGQSVPKNMQRYIADYPGVLKIFDKLSSGGETEITTPEGHILVMNQLFHSNVIRTGDITGYEPQIRKSISKLARPGMAAYDIGANIGIFSFLFSALVKNEGIVYAFEPEKNNYICFEKSLKINKSQNILLDKRAVGREKESGKFDRRGGAFSGRLVGKDAAYKLTKNIEEIDIVNVDYLINNEKFRIPDIMKIDVEGNEAMVLEGMENVLANYNPIIICELHTHLGESSDRVIDYLSKFGYTFSTLNDFLKENEENKLKSTNISKEIHIIARKEKQ